MLVACLNVLSAALNNNGKPGHIPVVTCAKLTLIVIAAAVNCAVLGHNQRKSVACCNVHCVLHELCNGILVCIGSETKLAVFVAAPAYCGSVLKQCDCMTVSGAYLSNIVQDLGRIADYGSGNLICYLTLGVVAPAIERAVLIYRKADIFVCVNIHDIIHYLLAIGAGLART